MKRKYSIEHIALSAIALSVISVNSVGQTFSGTLEEVTVTSRKIEQSLQDVSISVNVMDGEKISDAGITKIEDIQAYVPNLSMSETGIGTNIYIRGIGSGINQGFEQSVGMYKDGVSLGRAQLARAPFLDLARVEVLRGPQNILYGKNSIAGAISLVTAQPTQEFEGSVSLTYEPEYGEQIGDLIFSGGLTDTLSARIAHRTRTLDGYVENIDANDEPDRDEQTTRVTLHWDATDTFDATLMYEKGSFDVTGRQVEIITDVASVNPNLLGQSWSDLLFNLNALSPLTGAQLTPESVLNTTQDFKRSSNGDFSTNDNENITLTVNWDLGDLTLTSVTSSLEYDYKELCDCDFTSANLFSVESEEDYSQLSQEFRLSSSGGDTIDWVAGLFYQASDLDFEDAFTTEDDSILESVLDTVLPGLSSVFEGSGAGELASGIAVPRVFKQESDVSSAFAQGTWNINDVSRLIVGGRYAYEEKSASRTLDFTDLEGNRLDFDTSFVPNTSIGVDYLLGRVILATRHDVEDSFADSQFTPSVVYEHDVNENTLAYVSWARGSKSAGYDARSNASPDGLSVSNPFSSELDFDVSPGTFFFKEEKAETLEFGLKTTLLDNKLELNTTAFIVDYEDLQISIFDGSLGFNVGNAASATTQGIEIDTRLAVNENFSLSGALAWLDFEFDDFENGQCTQAQRIANPEREFCDYSGFSNQYVADFSGYLSGTYVNEIFEGLYLEATLDMVFTTDYNPSQNLDPLVEQSGYTKFNSRLELSNVDDSWSIALIGKNLTDENIVTYANDAPLATGLTQSISHYGFVEPPRTLAIQGTYNF